MNLKMSRRILVASLCLAGLTACGSEGEDGTTPASQPGDAAAKAVDGLGGAMGDAMGKAKDVASDAMGAMKDQYADQIKDLEAKIEPIKTAAKGFNDGKLNGLLGSLDDKLAAAKSKVASMTGGDAASVTAELKGLMGDLPKLYEQAMARLTELKGGDLKLPKLPGGGN